MGSCSAGEANTNGIDASEGALVWVRRRNGSWWPGRIMGLHELSQSCLVSPRSGTPVKLLGRQDASVDWYNLEKSKRVKAFRCGEYDECIEKAKASAANSNKKAVKYARREDAIIHALELESARVGKEPLVFCSRTGKFVNENGVSGGDSLVVSHSADGNEDISDDDDNSNSAPELSQSGISFEEPNQNDSTKMQSMPGRRRRTPNDSEDDGMEGVKRMRGLEDLGVGVVSKRKVPSTSMPEMLQQDSTAHNSSNTGSYLVNGTIFNGVKGQYSSLKRKRSQVTNAQESLKRKNRRRQLTKVLESTAMVSVPVTCDQLPTSSSSLICTVTDGKNSRLDSNDLKKSSLQAINMLSLSRVAAPPPVSPRAVLPAAVQRVVVVRHHCTQRLVCSSARVLPLFLQLYFLVSARVSPHRASVPPSPLFRGCCCLNCCSSSTFCLCNNRSHRKKAVTRRFYLFRKEESSEVEW